MCVVSLVSDHYFEKWGQAPYVAPKAVPAFPWGPHDNSQPVAPTLPSQAEIDEFRRLLERAREYDKQHHEPHCALKEKQERLLKLAKELGIDISFVTEEADGA